MFKKIIIIFFLLLLFGIGFYIEKPTETLTPINSLSIQDSIISLKDNSPVAIIGDLQRTTIGELIIGREQNEPERKKIIKNIVSKNPSALIILGDMVSNGSHTNEWIYLKNLLKPIEDKNIPIIPILGNHDCWGNNTVALKNAGKCFPVFRQSHWYSKRYGDIVFIILDSNKDDLPEGTWRREKKWFENELKYYDSEPSVKGIIVCFHHPPYTNSIVTRDNINVQEAFVPPFENSQKTLAIITGHAHTYERFKKKGKIFIVSGGGGGPRVILKTGKNIHKDLVNLPPLRPFNYLLLYLKPEGIEIVAKGLNKDSSVFFTIDHFSILFNNSPD